MTIRISFPQGQGTVRVECDGQVVEVPLPGSGGGGGGQVANDPDEPQSSGRTPRTTLPRDPRAPITRPPNEPPIAGIVTTGRSAPGVLDAFGMRRLFATPRGLARYLDVREVYSATPEVLRHQVMGWRGERRPGLPFLIDPALIRRLSRSRARQTAVGDSTNAVAGPH